MKKKMFLTRYVLMVVGRISNSHKKLNNLHFCLLIEKKIVLENI